MVNEYGIPLDRNGYAPSIASQEERCYFCGCSNNKLDRHEIFHGPYRTKSKALGLWVLLCHDEHMELHNSRPDRDKFLKRRGQEIAMCHYHWSVGEFRKRFGKNYL